MDIGKLEHELEKRHVVLGLAAHRNDNGVNVVFLEIGVIDHRCLEALGRIAEMGNELRASADRHWRVPLLSSRWLSKGQDGDLDAGPCIRTHFAAGLSSKRARPRSCRVYPSGPNPPIPAPAPSATHEWV